MTEPSNLDYALHGRLIQNSLYKEFWNTTVMLLNRTMPGPIVKRLSKAKTTFDLQICPTACIVNFERIYVNPTFFHTYIQSPEDLCGVLLHELLHPFVDPFMEKNGEIWNIVEDVLINALVYSINPKFTGWMDSFYNPSAFPEILTSPGHLKTWEAIKGVEEHEILDLNFVVDTSHVEGYKALYALSTASKPSLDTIYQLYFKDYPTPFPNYKVIGVLKDPSSISDEDIQKAKASQEVSDIEKSMDSESSKGHSNEEDSNSESSAESASKSGQLKDRTVDLVDKEDLERSIKENIDIGQDVSKSVPKDWKYSNNETLKNSFEVFQSLDPASVVNLAFKASALPDIRNIITETMSDAELPERSLIPYKVTKSGLVMLQQGFIPTFWRKSQQDTDDSVNPTTAIYVDVSGSFIGFIPWTITLITQLFNRCRVEDMYVFSTVVVPVSVEELQAGKYKSTGGTSFSAVVNHFLSKDLPKALIITDGFDYLDKATIQKFQDSGKQLYVLLISSYETPSKEHLSWTTEVFTHTFKRGY